jgi:hypothetical protein
VISENEVYVEGTVFHSNVETDIGNRSGLRLRRRPGGDGIYLFRSGPEAFPVLMLLTIDDAPNCCRTGGALNQLRNDCPLQHRCDIDPRTQQTTTDDERTNDH